MINFDEQLSRLHGDVERYRRLEKERIDALVRDTRLPESEA